jgi:hypothetical protein
MKRDWAAWSAAKSNIARHHQQVGILDRKIARIDGRLTLIQWMLALLIGGVASLLVKALL